MHAHTCIMYLYKWNAYIYIFLHVCMCIYSKSRYCYICTFGHHDPSNCWCCTCPFASLRETTVQSTYGWCNWLSRTTCREQIWDVRQGGFCRRYLRFGCLNSMKPPVKQPLLLISINFTPKSAKVDQQKSVHYVFQASPCLKSTHPLII